MAFISRDEWRKRHCFVTNFNKCYIQWTNIYIIYIYIYIYTHTHMCTYNREWHISLFFYSQILHLFAQTFICYFLMHTLRPGIMEKAVLLVAMVYLAMCHIYRVVYDYGGYTLDITGFVSLLYCIIVGLSLLLCKLLN